MKRLRRVLRQPHGQVLLATLLFCFIFTILFAGLLRSGIAYRAKTRATRSADLTCLSGGAVYANGLQLTRYANVVLTTAIVVDLVKMAAVVASTGGTGVEAALLINSRGKVQDVCDIVLGIEKRPGIYPFVLLPFETNGIARDNGFKPSASDSTWNALPIPPLLLYNLSSTPGPSCLKPSLGLRFRTGKDLLKALENITELPPLYLTHDRRTGASVTLTADQVAPCQNAHPNQMCVKPWVTRYAGQFCSELQPSDPEKNTQKPNLLQSLGKAKWALNLLEKILDRIKLDITDKTDPPDHSLTLYGPMRTDRLLIHQTSAVRVEGKGIAAWDLGQPPYRVRLVPVPFDQLPLVRQAVQAVPADWSKELQQASALLNTKSP